MRDRRQHWCILSVITCVVAFWAAPPAAGLVVSEVMYHPAGQGAAIEFIELYNERAVFEDLSGFAFTNGIEYEFGPGTILGAKEYLVVAADPNALEAAYQISGVYGPFSGRLNNDGERVEFSNTNGEIIISFRYDDESPWPASPDGALADPGEAGRRPRRGIELVTQHLHRRHTGRAG